MPRKYGFSRTPLGGYEVSGFPLVEFDRKPFDQYPITGFALDWNDDLTLFQDFDTELFQLNGYAVLRNSDIQRYRAIPEGDLLARAVGFQKIRPAMPNGVSIGSLREAAESAGAKFPLITIHRERIKKNVCHIGSFQLASQRTLTVREISTQAEWEDEDTFALRDITKLEFDGTYERLLCALAK
jgi:hypothetical protein